MTAPAASVEQCDRDAAAEWMRDAIRDGMIRRGSENDIPLAKAFANHRHEQTSALREHLKWALDTIKLLQNHGASRFSEAGQQKYIAALRTLSSPPVPGTPHKPNVGESK
jgi:hypothetical protein